jgi:hypothetical protein
MLRRKFALELRWSEFRHTYLRRDMASNRALLPRTISTDDERELYGARLAEPCLSW